MLQNMEEQSRSLVSVSREIALRLNELNAGLKENMKAFTETVEGGTVKTLTEFDNSLGEITQRLSQTITEIRDSIDDLPVVIESLKQHVS
jgi:methyl-accepting chemotaxis protein